MCGMFMLLEISSGMLTFDPFHCRCQDSRSKVARRRDRWTAVELGQSLVRRQLYPSETRPYRACSQKSRVGVESLTESVCPNEGFAFGVTWLEMGMSLA